MNVWVLVEQCDGCECPEPRAIFTTEEAARAACEQNNQRADADRQRSQWDGATFWVEEWPTNRIGRVQQYVDGTSKFIEEGQ